MGCLCHCPPGPVEAQSWGPKAVSCGLWVDTWTPLSLAAAFRASQAGWSRLPSWESRRPRRKLVRLVGERGLGLRVSGGGHHHHPEARRSRACGLTWGHMVASRGTGRSASPRTTHGLCGQSAQHVGTGCLPREGCLGRRGESEMCPGVLASSSRDLAVCARRRRLPMAQTELRGGRRNAGGPHGLPPHPPPKPASAGLGR